MAVIVGARPRFPYAVATATPSLLVSGSFSWPML